MQAMNNFLEKLKMYIQMRIESVEYFLRGTPNDGSMRSYYNGYLRAFQEMLQNVELWMGEEKSDEPTQVITMRGTLEDINNLIPFLNVGRIVLIFSNATAMLAHQVLNKRNKVTFCMKDNEQEMIDYFSSHSCKSLIIIDIIEEEKK